MVSVENGGGRLTASRAGDKNQVIWILDQSAAELGSAEDGAGDEEAPEAGHVELFNDEVGANAWVGMSM